MMLLQRLTTQLPEWARPNHPILQHTLGRDTPKNRRAQWLQFVIVLVLLVGFSLGFALSQADNGVWYFSASEVVFNAVYYPLICVQVILALSLSSYTSNLIAEEKRKQTWDLLRATENGVSFVMRARWIAAALYRSRGVLAALYVLRLVLVALMLYDLTAFSGDYLALISGGNVVPQLPVIVVVVLVAAGITAALLLPMSMFSLDAAVGALLGAFIRNRVLLYLAHAVWVVVRIEAALGFLLLYQNNTEISTMTSTEMVHVSIIGVGAISDLGLGLLHLNRMAESWALIQYSIFMGVVLLVVMLMQVWMADFLVRVAVRRAENASE